MVPEIGFGPAGHPADFIAEGRGDDEFGAWEIPCVIPQAAVAVENRVAMPMARKHRCHLRILAELDELAAPGAEDAPTALGLAPGGRIAGKDWMMELHKHGAVRCIREFPLEPRELGGCELIPAVFRIEAQDRERPEVHSMPSIGSKVAQILYPGFALVVARAGHNQGSLVFQILEKGGDPVEIRGGISIAQVPRGQDQIGLHFGHPSDENLQQIISPGRGEVGDVDHLPAARLVSGLHGYGFG